VQPPRVADRVTDPVWAVRWEDDLVAADHAAIGELLARCFPRSRTPFGAGRSWSSGRPEVRIVARDGARAVAHLGVLRRFLRVAGTGAALLVGDVGLVAVDPSVQGRGLGGALLARTGVLLDQLAMPFGFLTCGDHVSGFYATAGWTATPGPTRMVRADGTVQVYGGVSMVLPVRAALSAWPAGAQVDRNGLEL
jgi:nodulation protein A